MKPWFNTALIIALTVIWIIIGWQLNKRLRILELDSFYHLQKHIQTEELAKSHDT